MATGAGTAAATARETMDNAAMTNAAGGVEAMATVRAGRDVPAVTAGGAMALWTAGAAMAATGAVATRDHRVDGRRDDGWRDRDRRGDGRRDHDRRDGDRRWSDGRDWDRHDDRRDYRRWERGRYPSVYFSSYRYRHAWRPPSGFYVRSWGYGDFYPRSWFGPSYWILDPWQYDLPLPPPGFDWVRSGSDALLIDQYTGRIVQVVRNIFWY